MPVYMDLETFSTSSIRAGSWRYAEDGRVLIWVWAVDDGDVRVWEPRKEEMPADLKAILASGVELVWQNGSTFDVPVLRVTGLAALAHERVVDTRVLASAAGLPGSLETLGVLLGLRESDAKDKAGHALIRMFCIPDKEGRVTQPEDRPAQWDQFINYAKRDVIAMREVYKRLPQMRCAMWRKGFEVSCRINDRGFLVDLDLARAAVASGTENKDALVEEGRRITEGALSSATQRDATMAYLKELGVNVPDLRAATVERWLQEDIPEEAKALLQVRLQIASNPAAKYQRLIDCVSRDGRLRGTLMFNGASRTGRFSGQLFQPHNLPRPSRGWEAIEELIDITKAGALNFMEGDVNSALSDMLRGVIIAPKGKHLAVADWSSIEGRALAWLAGEDAVLDAYRLYDAGRGFDAYVNTYAAVFGVDPRDVTKAQRQEGKVLELFGGYGGGVGAFVTFSTTYRVDLDAFADRVWPTIDAQTEKDLESFFDWAVKAALPMYGLSKRTYLACEATKRLWRKARAKTVALWKQADEAARRAINHPGEVVDCGRVAFQKGKSFLMLRLPSGRTLYYPQGRIEDDTVRYQGKNPFTHKWGPITATPGKWVENIVQAMCADLLMEALIRCEERGIDVVLHVHDEIIAETKQPLDALLDVMETAPAWAPDLPLAAAGFTCQRYRKE